MGDIPFRQYMLPDGRQKDVFIDRPAEISDKAKKIMAAGHRFECEVLTTGQVSLTIHHIKDQEDVDIRVVANGLMVPKAVDEMITAFKL